jgi:hypothetical protein
MSRSVRAGLFGLAVLLGALAPAARAGLAISLSPLDQSLAPGAVGFVEVFATNQGSTDVAIAQYQYTLATFNPADPLEFQSVTDAVVDYVFPSPTGLGIFATGLGTNEIFVNDTLFDLVPPGSPVIIAAGATVSLGLVQFQIGDSAVVGSFISLQINPDLLFTFYSDSNDVDAQPIAFLNHGGARIRVVPEPASVVSLALGCLGLAGCALCRRRSA